MTVVASHIREIRASDTKAMTARADALRREGCSIVTLSQGEPDFDTPEHVREAGRRAIDSGKTRYTPVAGILPLRVAIAAKLRRENALEYSPDQITVGCGAKQVIFNAFFATLDPGDEVVIPSPCWVSYPEMVRLAGGKPVVVETTSTGFKLTGSALEGAMNARTKWLVLNSPCNPTGALYSRDELRELATVLLRHPNVWVLSDDIYEKLIYGHTPFATMASAVPALADRALTVNGVSKSHAMTGWRVGYGAGPLQLIGAMNLIQSQTSSHTCSISQHAALEALDGDQGFLSSFIMQFRERRDLLVSSVNECPGLKADPPDGAFYVFVSCADLIGAKTPSGQLIGSDTDLAIYLLNAVGVAVVPGAGFLASPYVRISFAASMTDLREACARIRLGCERLVLPVVA